MSAGWVKIHRKIVESDELFGKRYDFAIFVYLIIIADRHTGVATVGRKQLANRFRAKESTIYKALKRLQKEQQINIKSNNRFSEITILKYADYQSQSNTQSKRKVTRKEQQSNTIQEEKKKEERKRESIYSTLASIKDSEIQKQVAYQYSVSYKTVKDLVEELDLYCQSTGKTYKNYKATLQSWVRRRIKEEPTTRITSTWKPEYDKLPAGVMTGSQIKQALEA